jgi:hypothetical protein
MGKRIQITESQLNYIIENVDLLNEQQPTQSKEGPLTVSFTELFKDNMISFGDSEEYRGLVNNLFSSLNRRIQNGEKIKSISINVYSSASKAPATNRLESGVGAPDHSYGGKVSEDYWMKYGDPNFDVRSLELKMDQLPDGLKDYDKSKGHLRVVGGNSFLAKNRGLKIYTFLKKALSDTLNQKGVDLKITDAEPRWEINQANKMVSATLTIKSEPFEETWKQCWKDLQISVNLGSTKTAEGDDKVGAIWVNDGTNKSWGIDGVKSILKTLQTMGPNNHWGKGSVIKDGVSTDNGAEKFAKLLLQQAWGQAKKDGTKYGRVWFDKDKPNNWVLLTKLLQQVFGVENINVACRGIKNKRKS